MEEQQSDRTRFIAGSNLHYFWSAIEHAELADGVLLLHRKRLSEFAPAWLLQELKIHWARHSGSHGGFSDHILLVNTSAERDPASGPNWDQFVTQKSFWAEIAFWLLKPGHLKTSGSAGPVDMSDLPNLGPVQVDWDTPRTWYTDRGYPFAEGDIAGYQNIFGLVSRYGSTLARETAWQPVNVALRAFAKASDSEQSSSGLIDAFTSIEALIGDKTESTFRLRFRAAHLLADDDNQRVEIMALVNRYYGARSDLVHGAPPLAGAERERFLKLVADPEPILDIARRLLVGVLRLLDQPRAFSSIKEFKEKLDAVLVHGSNREDLRSRMALRRTAV